jgi:hypothetical protein
MDTMPLNRLGIGRYISIQVTGGGLDLNTAATRPRVPLSLEASTFGVEDDDDDSVVDDDDICTRCRVIVTE